MRKLTREALSPRISKCHRKRMYAISVRIWRSPRLRKMGRGALGPRISKCQKENACHFDKDLDEPQIEDNGSGGIGPKNPTVSVLVCMNLTAVPYRIGVCLHAFLLLLGTESGNRPRACKKKVSGTFFCTVWVYFLNGSSF